MSLRTRCKATAQGGATAGRAALHIGAVALAKPQVHIHRFGSSLNEYGHFHVCVVDGVFEEMPGESDADTPSSPPGIVVHPATDIDTDTVAQVKATLRVFAGRGLLEKFETKERLGHQHSGFSVDAGVCIEAHDRTALERLCKEGFALAYRCAKQHSEPRSDKRGARVDELN